MKSQRTTPKGKELNLDLEPVAGAFAQVIANRGGEIACFGARGDGKTFGALIGMIMHAQKHHEAGYPLPAQWIGVTDTFRSHELKTCRSLLNPAWCAGWRLYDNNHLAVFRQGMTDLVHCDLFGIEDQGAMDRVRMESIGVWFEEPAPSAVLVQSSGISDTAWNIALTSQGDSRIKSHCYPAVITSNLPDEDHWTWQRFLPGAGTQGHHPDHAQRLWFRIPPGERASAEDRAAWAKALEDRPDLLKRLLDGEPGTVQLGAQVASGFNLDRHVSRDRLQVIQSEPLYCGQDFGHNPTMVIGQSWQGQIRVIAALTIERGGARQLLEQAVVPWLRMNAPWVFKESNMIHGQYDPAAPDSQDDIEQNPVLTLEKLLPGSWWAPAPSKWEERKGPLLTALQRNIIFDPIGCKDLIRALSGRWHYQQDRMGGISHDLPKKNHPWSDLGDALCYMLTAIMPEMDRRLVHHEPPVVQLRRPAGSISGWSGQR